MNAPVRLVPIDFDEAQAAEIVRKTILAAYVDPDPFTTFEPVWGTTHEQYLRASLANFRKAANDPTFKNLARTPGGIIMPDGTEFDTHPPLRVDRTADSWAQGNRRARRAAEADRRRAK